MKFPEAINVNLVPPFPIFSNQKKAIPYIPISKNKVAFFAIKSENEKQFHVVNMPLYFITFIFILRGKIRYKLKGS